MIVKRSISIRGHPTSISIEDEFWGPLREAAAQRGSTLAGLIATIDAERAPGRNLSSAIRVFVLSEAMRRPLGDQSAGGSASGELTPGKLS